MDGFMTAALHNGTCKCSTPKSNDHIFCRLLRLVGRLALGTFYSRGYLTPDPFGTVFPTFRCTTAFCVNFLYLDLSNEVTNEMLFPLPNNFSVPCRRLSYFETVYSVAVN